MGRGQQSTEKTRPFVPSQLSNSLLCPTYACPSDPQVESSVEVRTLGLSICFEDALLALNHFLPHWRIPDTGESGIKKRGGVG